MAWYSAIVIFESTVDGFVKKKQLCEQSIHLILAPNDDIASQKAIRIGKEKEHEYKNESGENVIWKFVQVQDVQEVTQNELVDGLEVHSKLFWKLHRRKNMENSE
jgi:hypothetical protein